MASKKRSGLGRGIGALIPQAQTQQPRPVDVFFPAVQNSANQENTAAETAKSAVSASSAQKKAVAHSTPRAGLNSAQIGSDEAGFVSESAKNAAGQTAETAQQLQAVPGAVFAELPLQEITANRVNPRKEFEQEALDELTHSIKEFGVFQPIVVREISGAATGQPRYEIIMGERRFRASGLAGKKTIPAIIRSTADENMLRDALLENLHRADLNPLEEASAYQQLMDDFGITQEQLAARIGRSRPQISNTIRLLRLPERVQARVAAGVLSAGHARAILALDDVQAMEKLADKIVNQGLTVREAEAAVKEPAKKRIAPRAGGRRQQLDEIAERLGDRFDTRVSIKLGAKKGQVVFEFASIADLNRILTELNDPGFQ